MKQRFSDEQIINIQKEGDAGIPIAADARAVQQGGMMTIRKVARIVIPAEGSVTLQPGGYHLMQIGLTAPLKSGDRVELKLDFEGPNRKP